MSQSPAGSAPDQAQPIYQKRRKTMHGVVFQWSDITEKEYNTPYVEDEWDEKRIVYAIPASTAIQQVDPIVERAATSLDVSNMTHFDSSMTEFEVLAKFTGSTPASTAASEQQACVSEADLAKKLDRVAKWIDSFPIGTDRATTMYCHVRDVQAALSGRATIPSEADERVVQQFDWMTAERIRDENHVDAALCVFREDPTGDNATGVIQAALTVWTADVRALAAAPDTATTAADMRECDDCDGTGRISPAELCARCNESGVLPGATTAEQQTGTASASELRNLLAISRHGDQSAQLVFASARACSAFIREAEAIKQGRAPSRDESESAAQGDGAIYARHAAETLAADARDAARYRWLRAAGWEDIQSIYWSHEVQRGSTPGACMAELDAAIDRAIAAMSAPATSKEKA